MSTKKQIADMVEKDFLHFWKSSQPCQQEQLNLQNVPSLGIYELHILTSYVHPTLFARHLFSAIKGTQI